VTKETAFCPSCRARIVVTPTGKLRRHEGTPHPRTPSAARLCGLSGWPAYAHIPTGGGILAVCGQRYPLFVAARSPVTGNWDAARDVCPACLKASDDND
jgi:hypothetical protein